MGVAQAMVIGAIFALIVSWVNPQQFTKDFFKGMGEGYGSVMGIIITAGVFAAGLKATGLIDAFVEVLKSSNEIARWGGSFGPFIMAAITGSGDAATFAFNEAVTPHAASFGMPIPNLGAMALISGQMGPYDVPHCRCCHCAFRFGYGTPDPIGKTHGDSFDCRCRRFGPDHRLRTSLISRSTSQIARCFCIYILDLFINFRLSYVKKTTNQSNSLMNCSHFYLQVKRNIFTFELELKEKKASRELKLLNFQPDFH